MTMFKAATRKRLKLRMVLDGPSGSGKSYTALRFGFALGMKVAAIDTEHRALSKNLGLAPDGIPWNFDVAELEHFAPTAYTAAIKEASRLGYDVLLIDSLSHAWDGVGGALDQVDKAGGNKFTAWKDVTPQHREMVEAILAAKCHVIATMRSKMEYVLEEQTNKQGKTVQVPKKVGMQPIQRAGMEYEFDVVGDLDLQHVLTISKTRCPALDGLIVVRPDANFVGPLLPWLNGDGQAKAPPPLASTLPDTITKPQTVNEVVEEAFENFHATQPNANGTPVTFLTMAEYKERVTGLCKATGVSADKIKSMIADYGVNRFDELSPRQAEDLLWKVGQLQNPPQPPETAEEIPY